MTSLLFVRYCQVDARADLIEVIMVTAGYAYVCVCECATFTESIQRDK